MSRWPTGTGSRYLLWAAALGIPLSEIGHTLAYLARYGREGLLLQSQGGHAYFPGVLQLSATALGLVLLAGLLVMALGRLVFGKGAGLRRSAAQPVLDLLVVAAAVQLQTYLIQEVVEVLAAHQELSFRLLFSILGWGLAGQLPVALLAALALSWLSIRMEAAVAGLRSLWQDCLRVRPPAPVVAVSVHPVCVPGPARLACVARQALIKRGPPQLLCV
jgi:hypothetical protein